MGGVISSKPSSLAGATIGTSWSSNGGTEGSGDISVPFNVSSRNNISQNISFKPRKNKSKNFLPKQNYTASPSKPQKVLNYNDFFKNNMNTIKK